MKTPPIDHRPAALNALEEGLKAIQALQLHTAQAHQKFLDTQAETGRTIQAILEKARPFASGVATTSPVQASIAAAETARPALSVQPAPDLPAEPRNSVAVSLPADRSTSGSPTPDPPAAALTGPPPVEKPAAALSQAPAAQNLAPALDAVLLAVVSELTGYPVETLAMDMDIEADLGIDSIKRVEILSTLEERIPGLEPVSPEVMAGLKTLGQIAAHLAGATPPATMAKPDPTAPIPSGGNGAGTGHAQTAITDTLLAVVSELTGYPVDTLAMDMDIEADLGIDSIKRVEILSALEERIPGLEPVSPEVMAGLKTLDQIAAHLAGAAPGAPEQTAPCPAPLPALPVEQPGPTLPTGIGVHVLQPAFTALAKGNTLAVASNRRVYVSADDRGLGKAIAAELDRRGISVAMVDRPVLRGPEPNLPGPADAAGLIVVADSGPAVPKTAQTELFLKNALLLARNMAPALGQAADQGGAFLATVTRIDGAFGCGKGDVNQPLTGALAGLAKTAALEWPGVICRALDVAPHWLDNRAVAAQVADELLFADPAAPVEVGLSPDRRITIELAALETAPGSLDLGPNDVVVVSGGGRGVTAQAALALARAARPKLALIGRSPEPEPEPAWLAGLSDPAMIKRAIAARLDRPTPMQIEAAFCQVTANRQISASLAALTAAGSQVMYFCADVGDRRRINGVFKKIRSRLGPVHALIHGAGVLEDRLITDKTGTQFETVFTTKVAGLNNLLAAAADDPLRHIVVFSSVAARFGNKGQSDYAMANEALNKLARDLDRKRPDCRVLCVNWGPWDGGMVGPALKKQFQSRGITLIPPDAGSRLLIDLMADAHADAVEIVVGGPMAVRPPGSGPVTEEMAVAIKRMIDAQGHPILNDHVIDGRPVVPLALIVEWLGHGALHDHPGLVFHGMDDLRVLTGIKLAQLPKAIRLMAGRCVKKETFFEVGVEIRDGVMADGRDMIHARGKAILASGPIGPPPYDRPAWTQRHPYTGSIDSIYDAVLFHGRGLRAIRQIDCLAPQGMVARLAAAPSPQTWIVQPLRSRWIADPLVLDGAFQMAVIWCNETKGAVSLPSFASAYRQYQERFPADGVTAIMEVRGVSGTRLRTDFTFLNGSGSVVATLIGVEAVMDPSLAQAFVRRRVIQRDAEG